MNQSKLDSTRDPVLRDETAPVSAAVAQVYLAIIITAGAALRLYHLDYQNLWMDEIASLDNARIFGQGGLRALAIVDHVAPLHSIILWLVTSFGSESSSTLRMPSVISSIATIPVMYWIGVRLFQSRRVGLLAAGLLAASPFAVWYAQEARMYALLQLCACLYVYVAWPVTYRMLRVWEVGLLLVVSVIGLYTHHFALFLYAAFGVFLILRGGIGQRRAWVWFATQVFAVLLFTYWMSLTSDRLEAPTGMAKPSPFLWVPYTIFSFVEGFSFGPSVRELRFEGTAAALRHHWLSIAVAAGAAGVLSLLGLHSMLRRPRYPVSLWLLLWLSMPLTLTIAATFVTNITYNVRYVIVSFPAVIIILALGIVEVLNCIPSRLQRDKQSLVALLGITSVSLLIATNLSSLQNWYQDKDYAKEQVEPVAALLRRTSTLGARTIVIDNFRLVPILAYYGEPLPANTLVLDNRRSDRLADDIVRDLREKESALLGDIWFLKYRSWESDPEQTLSNYIDSTYTAIQKSEWPGISVDHFRVKSATAASP